MRYLIDRKSVTYDRNENDVIVINLETGSYYSGSGPTADLWTLISQGASSAEAARKLASAYSCDENTVLKDVDKCVEALLERGLIKPVGADVPTAAELVLPPADRKTWAAPSFEEYTDMWDLIKLDPIHDTGELGWPVPKT